MGNDGMIDLWTLKFRNEEYTYVAQNHDNSEAGRASAIQEAVQYFTGSHPNLGIQEHDLHSSHFSRERRSPELEAQKALNREGAEDAKGNSSKLCEHRNAERRYHLGMQDDWICPECGETMSANWSPSRD